MKGILKQRKATSGGIEYQVAWVGDYAPTWEPPECLEHARDAITAFKAGSRRTRK